MNIMVFNVAAENRGALSVLNDFFEEFKKDATNNYFIVLSLPELAEFKNIKVLKYPWIKKSWLHRLYFDYFVAGKIVKANNIDEVFSMQNIIIPRVTVNQKLYLHQSLPFVDIKFSLFNHPILWVYQNLVGQLIYRSVRNANEVIVQTKWMKKACIEKLNIKNTDKIIVKNPKIELSVEKIFDQKIENLTTFFYPASGLTFKNHKIIVNACKILKEKKIKISKIIFTLSGNENKLISNLHNEVEKKQLPIEFIGLITRSQVFNYYSKSVLIFPSYIESFPLPLLEAKLHKCIILASDCPFSHEILDEYENAYFFNPFDPAMLFSLIEKITAGTISYKDISSSNETGYIK